MGYKLKSKSSAKKRFKFISSNKLKAYSACLRHNMCNKNKTPKQQVGSFIIKNMKAIKKSLPYKI